MSEIASFRSVIELWPTREALAADVGAGSRTVSKWWQRKRIPEEWWRPIADSSVGRRNGVTVDVLASLSARNRSNGRSEFAGVVS